MKTWLKRTSAVVLAGIVIGAFLWQIDPPEPKHCGICDYIKCHAPCIVNLNTGEAGELDLYEPHYTKVGELAEEQCNSVFCFVYPAGCSGTKTTFPWELKLSIPITAQRIDRAKFCRNCRTLLESYSGGYVVFDNHEKPDIKVYPIFDGAEYEMRCYSITIELDEEQNEYELTEIGTLDVSRY